MTTPSDSIVCSHCRLACDPEKVRQSSIVISEPLTYSYDFEDEKQYCNDCYKTYIQPVETRSTLIAWMKLLTAMLSDPL